MATTLDERIERKLDPDFKFYINREGSIQERTRFLMEGERMKNEYLGECLDYARWGGETTVMYEFGTGGLINFIQHWINLNQDNLIWNDKSLSQKCELPYIKYDKCPRAPEGHSNSKTVIDAAGRIRCAHITEKMMKPSFITESSQTFDEPSQTTEVFYIEDNPYNRLPEGEEDLTEDDKKKIEKWDAEEPSVLVRDVCYSILSDENTILSLEEVLDRLNLEPRTRTIYCNSGRNGLCFSSCNRIDELDKEDREMYKVTGRCQGHVEEKNITVHPFDGWTLAQYVRKWYKQVPNGKARVFASVFKKN